MTQATDPHAHVFTAATEADWTELDLLEHPDATLADLEPDGAEQTVEDYEADGWDNQAAGPKTAVQAREDLAARIADPACPDTAAHAGAYGEDD